MSYVPPHKRPSNEPVRPSPVPESVSRKFTRNLNLDGGRNDQDRKVIVARDWISKWLFVGSDGTEDEISPSVKLVPVSSDSYEWRAGRKPLMLVNNDAGDKDEKIGATEGRTPWLSVAEKAVGDIFMAFELAKNGKGHGSLVEVKPRLVARFGKVLLHGHPSLSLESLKDGLVAESTLRESKKSFYTNVSSSYMENIRDTALLKLGCSIKESDVYFVFLSAETRPYSFISCKCTVKEDRRLTLRRVEVDALRNGVVDVSCLDQNIDLRLMVYSKRIPTALTENEISDIRKLVDSAVVDPNVKGGLRWPLGEASSGGRYSVSHVWHLTNTVYRSSTFRLKVREADRFDFRVGTGEAAREVILVLKGISQKLEGDDEVERSSVSDMLKDALKMIWDHFLSADPYLM
ncbi:PREDICTED: uncharacterized protein LOC104826017 [Tarenaya hassleriana]|uniref:uncharacterized protein LOC104826017 n=1 Tax=Tarenaya hassleriana TaxID=28532 RepID=UPI00053C5200|nr:PREDICTED: uncharacterized protein LOC104826017 [Tarenaya hassleriana]XP_010556809.1 PREDICTED: uncharacterized protein LOC104826017 [Tarenaya hassleriana]XP_010556810.1 PREDICTED: uncharacterized protein LOC104826017 [Tarenaya hassleriana]XP_010556811.1 PREDICTED: uncharacterized protein LOC104826017 [Tarenaya hassleriana]XP_010556812.1 PREDICTED: uncharacterized protein LOC104826017 [Tarenaya hassleriana]